MIKTFRDAATEELFLTGKSRKLPTDIWKSGLRRLRQIARAEKLADLRGEGAKLECYGGNTYTVRVNDRYRVIFQWAAPDAFEVGIFDPH